MPDWADEAKQFADEHSDLADKAVQEAGQLADDKTGGRFGSQIQDAEQRAEGYLGTGQDPQQGGSQDPQQGGNY
jgi:hypothetical protein